MAKAIRKTVPVEIFLLLEVVAGVVGRHPVRDRIDIQMHLLGGLRLPNQHLAGWNQAADEFEFCVVQVKCFPVHLTVQSGSGLPGRLQSIEISCFSWRLFVSYNIRTTT